LPAHPLVVNVEKTRESCKKKKITASPLALCVEKAPKNFEKKTAIKTEYRILETTLRKQHQPLHDYPLFVVEVFFLPCLGVRQLVELPICFLNFFESTNTDASLLFRTINRFRILLQGSCTNIHPQCNRSSNIAIPKYRRSNIEKSHSHVSLTMSPRWRVSSIALPSCATSNYNLPWVFHAIFAHYINLISDRIYIAYFRQHPNV